MHKHDGLRQGRCGVVAWSRLVVAAVNIRRTIYSDELAADNELNSKPRALTCYSAIPQREHDTACNVEIEKLCRICEHGSEVGVATRSTAREVGKFGNLI